MTDKIDITRLNKGSPPNNEEKNTKKEIFGSFSESVADSFTEEK